MKSKFRLFVFFSIFCLLFLKLPAAQGVSFTDSDVTISMDFQDANLKDVVKIFSIQSGLNFIASEAVQDRKITLFLDKVPVQGAMDKLFKANNLTYELDEYANIFIVKDWGKPQIETVTKVFYLKYATVSSSSLKEEMNKVISAGKGAAGKGEGEGGGGGGGEGKWKIEEDVGITTAVKKILSAYGSVIEDYRTNSLIVTDIPSRMSLIAQTIASLDIAVPQVMLEVEMLDVSKNLVDKLGFNFDDNPITLLLPNAHFNETAKLFLGKAAYRGADTVNTTNQGALVWGNIYAAILDFLRTQTDTKTLARPRLLTLNNETAEIRITTDEVIGEEVTYDDAGNILRTAERTETGVSLRISPQINLETSEITMFISPTVKEATTSSFVGVEGGTYKDPEERGTKSLVKVKDGDTVILGGLIRNEFSQTITKLPILGDIPIVGALFRHKHKEKDKQRELLVFITPHIVKDTSLGLASAKKAKLPIREQGTGLAPERQMSINATLNSFEKIR